MTVSKVYSRRVSFNERMYMAVDKITPGFCIQILVEGEGDLSLENLENAVSIASDANPGTRLILKGVLGWSRWVADGPVPPVRIHSHWADDAPLPLSVERPLSYKTGPTCEIVFSQSTNPRIMFRCFHGVMDARGLVHFAEEVFRALRGEKLIGSDCMLNDTEFIKSMVGNRKREALNNVYQSPTAGSTLNPGRLIWKKVSLSGPTPGLVAKIAVSLARYAAGFHNSVTRVMIPIDIRNYKRDMLSSGNMTYPIFIDVTPENNWGEIQKTMLKLLAKKVAMRLDPGESIVPWMPLWLIKVLYNIFNKNNLKRGRFIFSALISHLSMDGINFNGPGFKTTSLYFVPQQTDIIPLCVSIVSSKDSAEIVVSTPDGLLDEIELSKLCEAVRMGVVEENAKK